MSARRCCTVKSPFTSRILNFGIWGSCLQSTTPSTYLYGPFALVLHKNSIVLIFVLPGRAHVVFVFTTRFGLDLHLPNYQILGENGTVCTNNEYKILVIAYITA